MRRNKPINTAKAHGIEIEGGGFKDKEVEWHEHLGEKRKKPCD